MPVRPRVLPVVVIAALAHATAAWACPICVSDTGEAVRATLFGPGFYFNAFVAVVPFLAVLAVCPVIERLLAPRPPAGSAPEDLARRKGGQP